MRAPLVEVDREVRVRITRNVSAGSKACAAAGATDAARSAEKNATDERPECLCGTCGTRKHEAEDERGHAEQPRADEEDRTPG